MTVTTGCARHPRRERAAACSACGAGVCRECVVHTAVGIKCPTCTGAGPSARRGRSRGAATGGRSATGGAGRSDRPGRPRWLVPVAVAAVALVALVLLTRSGGEQAEDEQDVGQDATQAYPQEREVDWRGGGGVTIGATLTLPAQGRTPVAAVLLVPGFGAIDRDSVMSTATPDGSADRLAQDLNLSRPGTPDRLMKDVSDVFAQAGIATLRYDKRGSARSQLPAGQTTLSYDDLVADAKAGLEFLGQRVETASVPKVVLGHDQGGLVAMRLAREPTVKAVVLASTFGRPLADVVGDDFIAARGDVGHQVSDQLHAVAAQLAAGGRIPPPEELSSHLRPLLVPAQEGYLRAVFGLDPVAEARGIRVPTLIVRGEKDPSVTGGDSERLRSALPAGTEEVVMPGADHNLIAAGGRRDAATLGPLSSWITTRAGG